VAQLISVSGGGRVVTEQSFSCCVKTLIWRLVRRQSLPRATFIVWRVIVFCPNVVCATDDLS
jgi:hypothetical protein